MVGNTGSGGGHIGSRAPNYESKVGGNSASGTGLGGLCRTNLAWKSVRAKALHR